MSIKKHFIIQRGGGGVVVAPVVKGFDDGTITGLARHGRGELL
jgi:hypothetical protein